MTSSDYGRSTVASTPADDTIHVWLAGSCYGIGAVTSDGRYLSRPHSRTSRKHKGQRSAVALLQAIQHWHERFTGNSVVFYTTESRLVRRLIAPRSAVIKGEERKAKSKSLLKTRKLVRCHLRLLRTYCSDFSIQHCSSSDPYIVLAQLLADGDVAGFRKGRRDLTSHGQLRDRDGFQGL